MTNNKEEKDKDYLSNWKTGEDICIIFDDKTGDQRTSFQIDEMFTEFKSIANKYGFDLNGWGLRDAFERRISKKYIIEKMHEAVTARDLQLAQKYPEKCEFLKDIKLDMPELKY